MKIEEDGKYKLILSMVPDLLTGRKIAQALVERRLAACVNLVNGVESTYRWKGEVQESAEVMLVIKTTAVIQDQVLEALRELHPYEVPEGVVVPVAGGLEKYLAWIDASVG